MNIRVTLIEDDETIREGLAYLINQTPDCRVVSDYPSVELALKSLNDDWPDVLLLDITLPGKSGLEALPELKKAVPHMHILMLTVHESEEHIFKALNLGAAGYLTKNAPQEKIIDAIHEVMQGGGPMSASIARMVINSFKRSEQSPLSARETEILEQLSTGKSRKRIADELFIDQETVKTHLKNIYFKLEVHSKADAIEVARKKRLI